MEVKKLRVKTREKILNASIELFNKKKSSNVSTVQISAAMGISPGNLYYYFANKEEIIRCIWKERMVKEINNITNESEKANSVESLLLHLEDWINHLIEYRFFYSELSTIFINDESMIDIYNKSERQTIESFTSLVDIHSDDPNHVSKMIVIHSSMAMAFQQLCYYDAYISKGKTKREYIGLCLIRLTTILEAVLPKKRIDEMTEVLAKRGLTKEKYNELYQ